MWNIEQTIGKKQIHSKKLHHHRQRRRREVYQGRQNPHICQENRENPHKIYPNVTYEAQVVIPVTTKKQHLGLISNILIQTNYLLINIENIPTAYRIIQIMSLICHHRHDSLTQPAIKKQPVARLEFEPIQNCIEKLSKSTCEMSTGKDIWPDFWYKSFLFRSKIQWKMLCFTIDWFANLGNIIARKKKQ